MVIAIAAASFLVVFMIVAGKSLLNQRAYQARVISKKEQARDQLKKNIDTANTLTTAYQAFVSTPTNVIGGNPSGKDDKDGDNAKIILDALPSTYDFPALATSIEKILTQNNLKIQTISGNDDQLTQQANTSSTTPIAIPMPFQAGVTGDYGSIQSLVSVIERSIRPIQIQTMTLQGSNTNLSFSFTAQTYYQPAVSIKAQTEVVK